METTMSVAKSDLRNDFTIKCTEAKEKWFTLAIKLTNKHYNSISVDKIRKYAPQDQTQCSSF
jgi:hypothetical protein